MRNPEWIELKKLAVILECKEETLRRNCVAKKYICRFEQSGKFKKYEIDLNSLPEKDLLKYQKKLSKINNSDICSSSEYYTNAPEWSKKQADKYLELLSLTKEMKRNALEAFVKNWNKDFPENTTSVQSIYKARVKYEEYGVAGLLSHRGKYSNKIQVNSDYYEYYKSLYLREGAPSVNFCWQVTLGYAKSKDNISPVEFPSARTFDRMLKSRVSKQAIYYARFGNSAWNKKFATFIPRDYSNILAGSCWVSDHAQIDVAVKHNNTTCFPWVTVFRDVKTSKWLGWFLHAEAPNSDHIFQAFYYGTEKFGLPDDVYIDNGKDYRCRDFAGGRKIQVKHNTQKENALLVNMGINVHYALPYNAQTKPVERDFLKIKSFLSKGFVGYRGGKITERPEKLKNEIKSGKIMNFDDFKLLFDDFIENYLNKKPSKGNVLQGKCPDELWSEEYKTKKVISKDALRLFCMRTSKTMTIGRNGIYDSQLQLTYWGEWMICEKGRKVFIRRDIKAYQEAWVFDALTEEYLGKANVYHSVSFLAKTNIEKEAYKNAIALKNKEKKLIKAMISTKYNPTNEEIVANLKSSLNKVEFNNTPKISQLTNTKMDKVIKQENTAKVSSKFKYVAPAPKPKRILYLTESQKRRAEESLAKQAL